ncbi:hypothetical protein FP026_25830 [Rhizobium tropici]|uniref:OmpA family protein n=1 Tax=Rhizobium tropici TaxID=398 RepID=A0A5B0VQU5_RHITR|nr:hypothetical protein [Rhizobium tropici]KAA1176986.1 hypothetical protein FP026_25830 [Rhizobium tropici]
MATLALLDMVSPYVVGGAAIGQPLHELLSALFVTEIETAFDDNGICLSGIARFSANVSNALPTFTPPFTITWNPNATVDHRTQRTQGAYWDFPDIAITFQLTAPRISSPVADLVVSGGPGGNPAALNNGPLAALLAGLGQGQPAPGQTAADSVDTVFHLDLLFDAATLHLPFLTGALLQPDGMLVPDPQNPEVTLVLPKIKLSIDQTAGATTGGGSDPQVSINFDSWAAFDINDPAGAGYGDLLRMQPPYAFFGPDDVLGFGFNSLLLDLSGTETPAAILEKFGVGDDFRGFYAPDVRVFIQPPAFKGLGVDVSARELLFQFGSDGGLSAIFGLDVVNPDAAQGATITIYDEFGGLVDKIAVPDVAAPPAPPFTSEIVPVPRKSLWVVDVTGGQPPYNINIDGKTQTTDPIVVQLAPNQTSRTVGIDILDVHAGAQPRHADVRVALLPPSLTAPEGGFNATSEKAVLTVTTAGPPGYAIGMLDFPEQEKLTIVFAPETAVATLSTAGEPPRALPITAGRASVSLPHGALVDIGATWNIAAQPPSPVTFHGQFQYDQPLRSSATPETVDDPAWATFASNPENIRTIPSADTANPNQQNWQGVDNELVTSSDFNAFVAAAKAEPDTPITLAGEASKEKVPVIEYNFALSQRRIWAIRELLTAQGVTNQIIELPEGEQPPTDPYLAPGRGAYRRVLASIPTGGRPATTATAAVQIARPARKPVPAPFKPPVIKREAPGNDSIRFKELHVRVELDHNRLIAIEIRLKVDVTTVLESYLTTVQQQNPIPRGQGPISLPVGKAADPNDGVLDIRLQLTLDDTVGRWQMLASLFEQDSDGFLQTPPPTALAAGPVADYFWRDYFGLLIALAPLLDAVATSNTPAGDLVALGIGASVPLAAAELDVVHVPRITLYGGELVVAHDPNGTQGALLLDVEVALVVTLNLAGTQLIDTDPTNPITVRYKAVGFKTSDKPQIRDVIPVFDSSKGFTINIPSTGGIRVPAPLGDILQVSGARIARSNPANLELDLGLKVDLGVITVDKTTIRIPLEGGQLPTITALGVHINISGAIEGGGYLAIYPDGFAGQLDVSLPGLGVRVAAGLSVRHVPTPPAPGPQATAILLMLEVDFPVPIALGNSGLGIFGFGGLFALHFRRDEHPNDPVPALDWLTRVNGNPMEITGWVPDIDHWAIGLGAVLGTMDAGFTLNVKGMLIFEMPGPRILLVMKAKIIAIRPPREGNPTATILAVIDIDLGRRRITIGLTFDYEIKPLLAVHIPTRAIFPFDDLAHFAIDVGSWYNPATVTFFDLFKARGYFMIRGKGIPDSSASPDNYDEGQDSTFPLLPLRLGGFAIATGVSVSFTWGDVDDGLYLSVGAAADAGLGFAPILFTGEIRLWGELHLWVVSIEAAAKLTVVAGQVPDGPPVHDPDYPGDPTHLYQPTKNVVQIDGEVHGEVDLFFFTVSGSVHVTLGSRPDDPPAPPPLVNGVSLQSRAAALLAGVSSDRPIDGKLVDAHADGSAIPDGEAVPIDAIIVLHFDCTPRIDGVFSATQPDPNDASKTITTSVAIGPIGPSSPAVHRGTPYYTYRLKGISIDHALTPGEVPAVWWPNAPNPTAESKRELALLTRVPDAHPSAVERSRHAEDFLRQHWATICDEVAPATSVLWTFHDQPLGPSSIGWQIFGTAWPDPPQSMRQTAPKLRLDIAENWRSGNPVADLLVDVAPARVIGGYVTCPDGCTAAGAVALQRPDVHLAQAQRPRFTTIRDFAAVTSSSDQRASLAWLLPGLADATRQRVSRGCYAKLLEAPFQRPQAPDLRRGYPLAEIIDELLAEASRGDDYSDVLTLATGQIVTLRVLIFAPDQLVRSGRLQMRYFDADGNQLDTVKIAADGNGSLRIQTQNDLPKSWINPKGPWACRVIEVFNLLSTANRKEDGAIILVDTNTPAGTAYVQFGIVDLQSIIAEGFNRPSYLVGVIETLTAAEVARETDETLIQNHKKSEINGALAPMTAPPALLLPNTEYAVSVEWEWATCNADGSDANTWNAAPTQTFRFRTDNQPLAPRVIASPGDRQDQAKTMPVRLDPWVITTDPDEGERFYFHGLPIRIVFAVDYLLTMFKTYGVELQAKVRAASYKNAAPTSPGFPNTFAVIKDAVTAVATDQVNTRPLVGVSVLSPWEGMIRDVLANAPCIPTSGAVTRHTIVDINLLLEPSTDFILDIEPVNPPPPPPGKLMTPLFRRAFTTSRYANPAAMCADVSVSKPVEFPASGADIAALLALLNAPQLSRSQIDAALGEAGLRPVVEVKSPEVEVLWVPDGGALQPRLIVIRTPEPLVRTRKEPQNHEPPGQPRLQREVISLVDKPYLEVVPTAGIGGAAPLHIISEPGLNLVIVAIDAGRNKPIALSLRVHENQFLGEGSDISDIELLKMTLDAAIWEVA